MITSQACEINKNKKLTILRLPKCEPEKTVEQSYMVWAEFTGYPLLMRLVVFVCNNRLKAGTEHRADDIEE